MADEENKESMKKTDEEITPPMVPLGDESDDQIDAEEGTPDLVFYNYGCSSDSRQNQLKHGDYVKIILGNYLGMQASVIGEYGNERTIQYFKKTGKYWVLIENDYNYRGQHELKKIAPIITSQPNG